MGVIYCCTVLLVYINLGNSLESTRNQSPSKERFSFFDAELFQVFNEKENGNVVISPTSIKLLLGLLMEGAEGNTAEEIRAALRLPHEEEERRKEFNTWLSVLQVNKSPNVLKLANRMFLSDRYNARSDYLETLKKYYAGGVSGVPFEDPKKAARTINEWVSNQTSQMIPSIVQEGQIQPNHKMLLASAVYFKGVWSKPFASERTAVRCFYSEENKCMDSLMMTETGYFDYGYISRLDAKAIALPYKGGEFSMLLLLPSSKDNVKLLGRDLMHISLTSILSEMEEHEVFVQIPQFEMGYNEDLVESLKKIYVTQMFGKEANLSKIFENHLESTSVSRIFHSAKIRVNEEGSEGAAATGALFVPLMGGPRNSFVANRPFLFFVMNSAKNAVLFAGKVVSPTTSEIYKKNVPPINSSKVLQQRTQHDSKDTLATSRKNDSSRISSKEAKVFHPSDILDSVQFHEVKPVQRGQPSKPKFRSIKPLFSSARATPAKERGNGSSDKFDSSYLHPSLQKNLISQQTAAMQKETQNRKRGKNVPEPSKTYKRKEAEDWRHHVLFFT